ncbi:IS66 family insertion sequence element accessory protein TnpB, partial [Membranicola marinus]
GLAMISFTPSMKYYLYAHTTDMRKGFRGLSGIVRNELDRDPSDGSVYIFINRRRDKIKLLECDRTGFVLYYKSLESGTFEFPRDHELAISWDRLWMILEGISLSSVRQRKRYIQG